jgi:GNAT superfamily N-acetyltransferase
MRSTIPEEPAALRQLIGQAHSIWLAEWQGTNAGILRFETRSEGAADIVQAPGSAAITGLYVRPHARGLGIATALLEAALAHYRRTGFERCSVDFESFNPTAAAFWMKYFKPVCFSLIRHPEALL